MGQFLKENYSILPLIWLVVQRLFLKFVWLVVVAKKTSAFSFSLSLFLICRKREVSVEITKKCIPDRIFFIRYKITLGKNILSKQKLQKKKNLLFIDKFFLNMLEVIF